MGLVSQEPTLFATSILENILQGRPGGCMVRFIRKQQLCSSCILDAKAYRVCACFTSSVRDLSCVSVSDIMWLLDWYGQAAVGNCRECRASCSHTCVRYESGHCRMLVCSDSKQGILLLPLLPSTGASRKEVEAAAAAANAHNFITALPAGYNTQARAAACTMYCCMCSCT